MDRAALDDLFSATYEELRRLAGSVKGAESSETLSPTSLVNEAYLKLASSPRFVAVSALHFKRIAARAMRQVLIQAARQRAAKKRGSASPMVTFDESAESEADAASPDEVLALDQALRDLAGFEPRQASMVELRFFGGLGVAETARILDVSEATVQRDWRAARAWLADQLRRPGD